MIHPLHSIVVPVYKSDRSLRELYERTRSVFQHIDEAFELILVEDCGGDNSWRIMRSLRNQDERVKILRLTKNFGQHNALMCGFSQASGDFIITMDDDLQTPPEEIPKLITGIKDSDFDVVYGISSEKKHSLIRNLGSCVYRCFMSSIFKQMPRFQLSNFRIIRKDVIKHILDIPTPNPLVGLLLLKVTHRIGSVETEHHQRKYGKTTYNPMKLIQHFLNGILYNSTLPLKGVCILGIFTSTISIVLCMYYFYLYFSGQIGVQGWITIILLILFFFGILMFSVGIIGEYLLRIIQEIDNTPTYLVKDKDV